MIGFPYKCKSPKLIAPAKSFLPTIVILLEVREREVRFPMFFKDGTRVSFCMFKSAKTFSVVWQDLGVWEAEFMVSVVPPAKDLYSVAVEFMVGTVRVGTHPRGML